MSKDTFANEMYAKLGESKPVELLTEAQNRAVEAGHDFACTKSDTAVDDLEEEVAELREALEAEEKDENHIRNELGDCFFSLINLCRIHGQNVDDVIGKVTERWLSRKKLMEDKVVDAGYTWRNLPDDVSLKIWQEVKQELKQKEYQ